MNSRIVFNLVPLQDWQNPLTRFYRASYPLSKKVAFAVSCLLVYFFECVLVFRKKGNSFLEEIRMCAAVSPRFLPILCLFSLSASDPVVVSQQHVWVDVQ